MDKVFEEPAVSYANHYSVEDYLIMRWEEGIRYEYWDGELVAMSYATQAHYRISFNVNRAF